MGCVVLLGILKDFPGEEISVLDLCLVRGVRAAVGGGGGSSCCARSMAGAS